jgi:hypothetical protein
MGSTYNIEIIVPVDVYFVSLFPQKNYPLNAQKRSTPKRMRSNKLTKSMKVLYLWV